MPIDPGLTTAMAKFAELAAPGAASAVYTQIQKATVGKANEQMVNVLKQMIDDLLAERAQLVNIARVFEEQLVSEQITEEEIKYITETVIPAIKTLVTQMNDSMDPDAVQKMEDTIEAIETLLSVDMLKVLQLVGFNYKRAIGEPLTQVIQKLIMSLSRPDPQLAAENNRLGLELNLALANIVQDEDASERLKQVMQVWRGTSESS